MHLTSVYSILIGIIKIFFGESSCVDSRTRTYKEVNSTQGCMITFGLESTVAWIGALLLNRWICSNRKRREELNIRQMC